MQDLLKYEYCILIHETKEPVRLNLYFCFFLTLQRYKHYLYMQKYLHFIYSVVQHN